MVAVLVAWCVAAAVLAALVFRRVSVARILLVISCAICAVLSLVGSVLGGLILVVPMGASLLALTLLLRPETRAWFDQAGG